MHKNNPPHTLPTPYPYLLSPTLLKDPFGKILTTPMFIKGYLELMEFIWENVTPAQMEYLGIMHWRQLCIKLRHIDAFDFIAHRLYEVNPHTISRVTSDIFLTHLLEMVELRRAIEKEDREKLQTVKGIVTFLLKRCMPPLRKQLLVAENYHCFVLSALHRDMNTLKLLVQFITNDIVKGICDRLSEVLDPGAFHKILPLILRR